jgi:3-oxoacyl-[acyl-carrier protein] reductase
MQSKKWGRIVNIISTSVKEPIAMLGVSNTIRGAMASWAKTLASELGKDGITVNNVLPGYTRTQRLDQIVRERALTSHISQAEVETAMLSTVPAARFAEAAEIAHAVAFLCSLDSGYINGINLPVDGGRTKSL